MTARRKPTIRAPKPNHLERAQRQAVIDTLLQRALRGLLTIPEAAVLAEAWQAERRVEEKTRRRLTDTTRALARHREAADTEILRLEEQLAEQAGETAPEDLGGLRSASDGPGGAREGRDAQAAAESRTGDPGAAAA